jgi:PPK2 family polyphosphate:nucleotide phosphotransferase
MASQTLTPPVGDKIRLKDFDPAYTGAFKDKEKALAETEKHLARLDKQQEIFYACGQCAMLIILQGMDTSGKDGTIRHVFKAVDPQGMQITSFKQPTSIDLQHDFLWRVHQNVPSKGIMGVFNRSHYEDVLVVRVMNLIDRKIWRKRYDQINEFEELLNESGTVVLKFFLHISKDEQKKRLQERLDDPEKHWKFSTGDLKVRAQWDDYMEAYEDMLTKCNTAAAPWHIVPANRKWYRNLVVTQTIADALENLKLSYPAAEEGLDKVVIED